ncbi:MAG: hypothetical protein NVS9B4_11000 [Candidatus Acidiferrum sp.]
MVHVQGKKEPLSGSTHTVSQSGAMLVLPEGLNEGTVVTIENPQNQKRVDAKVVRPPQSTFEGLLVPMEFMTPSPLFWAVFFPPSVN